MSLPAEHIEENAKLEADAYVDLFQIMLRSGAKIYLKANNSVTWQGNEYESHGIKLTGVGKSADDKISRPSLQVANPEKIFSPLVRDGDLNRAAITRFRVLRQNIEGDLPIYQTQTWNVSRIASIRGHVISIELRDQTDGQNFITPARMYIPPEFPLVSLR